MRFIGLFMTLAAFCISPFGANADATSAYRQPEFVTPIMKEKKTEILKIQRQIYLNQSVLDDVNSEIQLILKLKSQTEPDTFTRDFMLKHPDAVETLALTTLVTGTGIKVFNEFHRWEDVRAAVASNPAAHKNIQILRARAMHLDRTGYRVIVAGAALSLWSLLYDTFSPDDAHLAILYRRIQALKDQPEIIEGMLAGKIQERIRLINLIDMQKEQLNVLNIEFDELEKIERQNITDPNQKNLREFQPVFVR